MAGCIRPLRGRGLRCLFHIPAISWLVTIYDPKGVEYLPCFLQFPTITWLATMFDPFGVGGNIYEIPIFKIQPRQGLNTVALKGHANNPQHLTPNGVEYNNLWQFLHTIHP